MIRKESEKESERPHYYSQFWLDVAAGRRIIGTPKPGSEEAEASEQETVEHILPRKTGRTSSHSDGIAVPDAHAERIAHPVVEPEVMADEFIEPTAEDLDLELQDEDQVLPPEVGMEDIEAPDMDLDLAEDDEEDLLEEEEEDETDRGWSGRRRKKPTPKRPTRQPLKKPKRDRRTY